MASTPHIRPTRHPATRADLAWIGLLTLGWFVLLLATDQMGYTRDESYYFEAGRDYAGWFRELWENLREGRAGLSFTPEGVERHWGYNPEHPVLMKTLFGLSWWLLHERLDWLRPALAFRLPAMAFGAVWVGLTALFALEATGRRTAGLGAALLLGLMPHVFFHSHLACFDVPIACMWLAFMYAYWRSLASTGWAWIAGAAWGVALVVKLNAFFLPVVLLVHWVLCARPEGTAGGTQGGERAWRPPAIPLAWGTMAILGPAIFLGAWPRHWFDTFNRVRWYMGFHMGHEQYFVDYFGQRLWEPPFPVEYPFVLTAITTPAIILALWGLGAVVGGVALRAPPGHGERVAGRRSTAILLAINALVPFAIIAMPSTPVFGGVKHWMAGLPFLCIAGGVGWSWLVDAVERLGMTNRGLSGLVVACVIVPTPALATWWSHPFGISYYNELIGGYTGAADAGMMRQFWGYASRQALPWLNGHAGEGDRINFHDSTWGAYQMYREEEQLRPDLGYAGDLDGADWLLYDHQRALSFVQTGAWERFGTWSPEYIVDVAGVPLISAYPNRSRGVTVRGGARSESGLLPSGLSAEPEPMGSGMVFDLEPEASGAETHEPGSGGGDVDRR